MANNVISKANPALNVKEFQDTYLRKNFENLVDYFGSQNQLLNFKFLEVTFDEATQNKKIAHGLDVVPEDIIATRITGPGTLQFNWANFDKRSIDISSDGPCRARIFVGSYWNFTTALNNVGTDLQQIKGEFSESTGGLLTVSTLPINRNYTVLNSDANKVLLFNSFFQSLIVKLPPAAEAVGLGVFIVQKIDLSFNPVAIVTANPKESFDSTATLLNLSTYKDTLKLVSNGSGWVVIDRTYSKAWSNVGYTSASLTTNGLTNLITLNGTGITQLNGLWRRDGNFIEILYGFRNGTGGGAASGTAGPISIPLPGVGVGANPTKGPLKWDIDSTPRDLSLGAFNGSLQVFTGGVYQGLENAQVINEFYFSIQNRGAGTFYTLGNIGLGFAMEGKMFFPVVGWGA